MLKEVQLRDLYNKSESSMEGYAENKASTMNLKVRVEVNQWEK